MDQSQSNSKTERAATLEIPRRTFTVEFFVGLFAVIGVAAAGYLSMGLAGFSLGPSATYEIAAEFDNISGLEVGASVEIAGVPVGQVTRIELNDPMAKVIMEIKNDIKIKDDDIVSIRTKGIIGDRFVKISRGGSDIYIPPGGTITETESVVDIEDIIGKFVHSFGSQDSADEQTE